MQITQQTVTIHYAWYSEGSSHTLKVWVDGQVVDNEQSIVYLDNDMAAAINDDDQTVTPGWWIEIGGYYFDRLHNGEDSGPLDALIRLEYDAKLAELRERGGT